MQIIDTERMSKMTVVDMEKPPLKTVPDEPFPRMLYRWPKEHYRTVIDRPNNAAPVERLVPNPPLTKLVNSNKELEAALKQGWRKEAFVPRPLEVEPNAIEYEGAE